ncbi:MAG TPA: lipid-A-disaccharide synthase [Geobacteraceae bacterium]
MQKIKDSSQQSAPHAPSSQKRIMIVAGEASGDLHGSNLVKEALRANPDLAFIGMGGPKMREAGVTILGDSAETAVVGLVEVISHFGAIYRAFATLRRVLRSDPPDLLILIDFPDFNLRLAKEAKKAGVKVLYYISPQVWAWRVGRVKKIARLVDRMAVVFPFEVPFYEKEGVPVTFVGHPLVDTVYPTMNRSEAQADFGLDPARKTVGLFPGSRKGEIKNLAATILEAATLLKKHFPDLQFVLPLASSLTISDIAPFLDAPELNIRVIEGRIYDVMQVCDAIISVSGTVTLEAALMGAPMVIIYRVSPLTYAVAKRLVKVEHIGICNIVAGERVVRELLQDDAEPAWITAEIARILTDDDYARQMRGKLAGIRAKLGSGGGSARVAEVVLEMLGEGRERP